jgi:hypothetical protein
MSKFVANRRQTPASGTRERAFVTRESVELSKVEAASLGRNKAHLIQDLLPAG